MKEENPDQDTATHQEKGAPPALMARDYRPVIIRNDTNGLSQSEKVRDAIYDLFLWVATSKGVDVLVLKSPPFTSPPWVSVECWLPHTEDSALTLRSSAVLSVRPREFYRFSWEIDLVLKNDKSSRSIPSIIEFDESNAEKILAYLLFETNSRKFGLRRCRWLPLLFWLPRNKPARLGVDPMAIIIRVLAIIGVITIGFGIGILLLLAAGIMAYISSKRRRHVLSAGKPSQEPRQLIRLDSWQTLIRDIGAERNTVLGSVKNELEQSGETGMKLANETIWHWGVEGKEERDQLVVRFRRGIAFVQIYQYGRDLFVGWDAHVNCGEWIEKIAGGGYDKATHELCAVHTISPGWHVPNEYDITDANCLIERVNAAITKVVKFKIAEHNIDTEIDFKILREPRQNVVGREGETPKPGSGVISRVFSKFQRKA